jgi:expansin (peptidoglycan-binding protein)
MPRPRHLLALLPLLVACSSKPGETSAGGSGGTGSSTGGSSTATTGSGGTATGPACASSLPEYTKDDGSVTFYTFDQGSSAVNCGFDILGQSPDVVAHVATGGGRWFGAMNTADYDTAATCGACVEVTRDGTRKVTITIVDQCPTNGNPLCTPGHIDLSKEAFLQIGDEVEGYLGTGNGASKGAISWRYVPCPTTEGLSFRLKEPTNQYWNQILVEGQRYAVAKLEVEVSGQWVSAVRQSYDYWQAGDGNMGQAPYHVRVTDVNGQVVEASLDLTGGDQTTSAQFPICQ